MLPIASPELRALAPAAMPNPAPNPAPNPKPAELAQDDPRRAALRRAAQDFEAAFLAEMLKSAGYGAPRENFGGGAGEDVFSSLLVREQAQALAETGGIGLAEHVYRALLAREGAAP